MPGFKGRLSGQLWPEGNPIARRRRTETQPTKDTELNNMSEKFIYLLLFLFGVKGPPDSGENANNK
jgi:hypothetical protein